MLANSWYSNFPPDVDEEHRLGGDNDSDRNTLDKQQGTHSTLPPMQYHLLMEDLNLITLFQDNLPAMQDI
jgi:hypothetical protein